MSIIFLNYHNFSKVILEISELNSKSRKITYLIYYFILKSEATKLNCMFRVPLAQLQPRLCVALAAESCQTAIY